MIIQSPIAWSVNRKLSTANRFQNVHRKHLLHFNRRLERFRLSYTEPEQTEKSPEFVLSTRTYTKNQFQAHAMHIFRRHDGLAGLWFGFPLDIEPRYYY